MAASMRSLGGGDLAAGVAVVQLDELLRLADVLADLDEDFLRRRRGGRVGLEVFDGLDLAVGGNGADQVGVRGLDGVDFTCRGREPSPNDEDDGEHRDT